MLDHQENKLKQERQDLENKLLKKREDIHARIAKLMEEIEKFKDISEDKMIGGRPNVEILAEIGERLEKCKFDVGLII